MVGIVNSRFNLHVITKMPFSLEMLVYSTYHLHLPRSRVGSWSRTTANRTEPVQLLVTNQIEQNRTALQDVRLGSATPLHLSLISSHYDKLPLEGSEEITTT
jgi:hypothetical protein